MGKASQYIEALIILSATFLGCSENSTSPIFEPYPTDIQGRVNAASIGDTVFIAPGRYTQLHEYTDILGDKVLVFCVVKAGIVVRGLTGDPSDVVVDAGGIGRGFWFQEVGSSTGLAAVTVCNSLGGIAGYEASPWIHNCVIENNGDVEDNPSSAGMGMWFDHSNPQISDCIFQNNEAAIGGGAAFGNNSNVHLERCKFIANRARDSGGGLAIFEDSWATIVDCTFLNNSAFESGGGIICFGDSIKIFGGTVSGNTSIVGSGGGIALLSRGGGECYGYLEEVNFSLNYFIDGYAEDNFGMIRVVCCSTNPAKWEGTVSFEFDGCE